MQLLSPRDTLTSANDIDNCSYFFTTVGYIN